MPPVFVKETHPEGIRFIAYEGMAPATCLQLAKELRGGAAELITQPEYEAGLFIAARRQKAKERNP